MEVMTRPSKRRGSGPRVMALAETQPHRRLALTLSGWRPPQTYAIHRLSADHTGAAFTPGIWNASPPICPVRRNQIWSSPGPSAAVSRRLVKESSEPSGDHRGSWASVVGLVMRYGTPLSVGASHTSLWRRSLSSTTEVTVKAMCLPDGAIAVPPTPVSR